MFLEYKRNIGLNRAPDQPKVKMLDRKMQEMKKKQSRCQDVLSETGLPRWVKLPSEENPIRNHVAAQYFYRNPNFLFFKGNSPSSHFTSQVSPKRQFRNWTCVHGNPDVSKKVISIFLQFAIGLYRRHTLFSSSRALREGGVRHRKGLIQKLLLLNKNKTGIIIVRLITVCWVKEGRTFDFKCCSIKDSSQAVDLDLTSPVNQLLIENSSTWVPGAKIFKFNCFTESCETNSKHDLHPNSDTQASIEIRNKYLLLISKNIFRICKNVYTCGKQ